MKIIKFLYPIYYIIGRKQFKLFRACFGKLRLFMASQSSIYNKFINLLLIYGKTDTIIVWNGMK